MNMNMPHCDIFVYTGPAAGQSALEVLQQLALTQYNTWPHRPVPVTEHAEELVTARGGATPPQPCSQRSSWHHGQRRQRPRGSLAPTLKLRSPPFSADTSSM
jgi:hypothetical protein